MSERKTYGTDTSADPERTRKMLDKSFRETQDGVALQSASHPVPPWYRRVLFWFWRPRLSPDAMETVELDRSRISKTGFRINKP